MVTFSVPNNKDFINFSVDTGRVLFAGSRNIIIPRQTCNDLIYQFGKLGFAFLTGCAKGVDESFRHALAESDFKDTSIVACAFRDRAERLKGVYPLYVHLKRSLSSPGLKLLLLKIRYIMYNKHILNVYTGL